VPELTPPQIGAEDVQRGVGRAVELFRMRQGLSRDQLAARADPPLSRSTILKIEKGERVPGADTIKRLADALDVSTDVLLIAAWVASEDDTPRRVERARITLTSGLFGEPSNAVKAGALAGFGVIALLGAPVALGAAAAVAAGAAVQDRERRASDKAEIRHLQEEVARRLPLVKDPEEWRRLLAALPELPDDN